MSTVSLFQHKVKRSTQDRDGGSWWAKLECSMMQSGGQN